MSTINRSQGHAKPASDLLPSEPTIIAGLAKATRGADDGRLGHNDWRLRQHSRVDRPRRSGFENFNQRIREGFFHLPHPARDRREFTNEERKAKFTVHRIEIQSLEPGQYWMMTIRSHDQFNTTIYGLDDRYRGVYNGRRVIFMNPMTCARLASSRVNSSISPVTFRAKPGALHISRSRRTIYRAVHGHILPGSQPAGSPRGVLARLAIRRLPSPSSFFDNPPRIKPSHETLAGEAETSSAVR